MNASERPSPLPVDLVRKILVVLKGGLPEAILAEELLQALRMRHPHARITALVPAGHAEAVAIHPAIHEVMVIPEVVELALSVPLWAEVALRRLMDSLHQGAFDLALAPSPARDALVDMAILASGASERIGWESSPPRGEDEIDARGWDGFYTRLIPLHGAPSAEPDRTLHFARALGMDPGEGPPSWPVCGRAQRAAAERLGAPADSKDSGWLALWCGPRDATGFQAWPEALRPVLEANPRMGLLLLGPGGRGPSSADPAGWKGVRCLDLRGSLAADEQLEILARCRVAVGIEGPWISLCIARRIPQVALVGGGAFGRYAPSSPWTTAVGLPLACYFCGWDCTQGGHHCLSQIPPQAITEAVRCALGPVGTKPRLLLSPVDPDLGILPLDLEPLLAPDSCERVRWPPVTPGLP